jgi:hypothetical protein
MATDDALRRLDRVELQVALIRREYDVEDEPIDEAEVARLERTIAELDDVKLLGVHFGLMRLHEDCGLRSTPTSLASSRITACEVLARWVPGELLEHAVNEWDAGDDA